MKTPKYTAFGVKDLDTFFCTGSVSAFFRDFPEAKNYRKCLLQGRYTAVKAAVLCGVLQRIRQADLQVIRLLRDGQTVQPAGILLPAQKVMLLDSDYFAGIFEKYPCDEKFFADTILQTPPTQDDAETLAQSDALVSEAQQRRQSFQQAAAALYAENRQALASCMNKGDLLRFLLGFMQKENGHLLYKTHSRAAVLHRTVSSVTGWGIQTFYKPFATPGMRTIVLKDNIGAVSETLLNGLVTVCLQNDLDIQLFHCTITGAPEHCVIPALSVGFFTENLLHPFPLRAKAALSASRFVRLPDFAEVLPEVRFNAAAADEMLDEAVFSQLEADEAYAVQSRILQNYINGEKLQSKQEQIYNQLVKAI